MSSHTHLETIYTERERPNDRQIRLSTVCLTAS